MNKRLWGRVEFWIAVGSLALLLAGVAVFYDPTPPPLHVFEKAPSTNHRSGYGLKAIYLVLGRVGFDVNRAETAAELFENTSRLVVVVQPSSRFGWDKNAATALSNWLRRGGHAFFVPGETAESDFAALGLSRVEVGLSADRSNGFEFAVRGPEKRHVSRVVWKTEARLKARGTAGDSGGTVLLGDDAGAVAMEFPIGAGRIVVASDPYLISNGGLRNAGNASYVAALFGRLAKSRAVFFDEFHHGFGGGQTKRGLWDVVTAGPGASILALIILVFLVWAVSAGRRFGAAVRVIRTERRSTVEYVEAYAALLRRAGRDGLAVWFIADAFRHEVARRLGAGRPPDDDGDLARRFAVRWGGAAGDVQDALARARRAPKQALSEGDVLMAAKRLESQWRRMVEVGRGRSR
ncbi:MAG: DUF4350 domain-containing protein [Deltaproteobacteria bacterium]|nr:DUF4350 domain-containing protein [Deltaproteobacteria bacterium]